MKSTIRKVILSIMFLSAMSLAQASVKVYVPLGGGNEVLVIDGDRDEVIGRIDDVANVHGLSATPNGDYLVAGSMSLAPKDQKIPEGMTADEHSAHHKNPDGEEKSVNYGASLVSLLNTETMQIVQRIEVNGITHRSAVTPDGRYAVSTHTTAGNISIIDLVNRKLIKTISTGPVPNYVLISGDGRFFYVSNSGNNTLSEIETDQWTLRRTIDVGSTPEHMVFSPDEETIYVINVGDNSVARVSLTKGKVINTYPVGEGPHGIALSDDSDTLFVSSKNGNQLNAINTTTGKTKNITLAPSPYHIASITGTGKLYVTSRAEPWIWVLDQDSLDVLRKIPIAGSGHQMVVMQQQ
jgi:YVTN family beta-propeller protein